MALPNIKKWSLKRWTVIAGFVGAAIGFVIFMDLMKAIVFGLGVFFVVGVIIEIVVRIRRKRRKAREAITGIEEKPEPKPEPVILEAEAPAEGWAPRS